MTSANEKKLPLRKCMGCGEHFPKNSLVRVLRSPNGEVVLDTIGKLSGRGAYICKKNECFNKARRTGRLERSLECTIPQEVYDKMEKELLT